MPEEAPHDRSGAGGEGGAGGRVGKLASLGAAQIGEAEPGRPPRRQRRDRQRRWRPEREPRRRVAGEYVVAGRSQPVAEAGEPPDRVEHAPGDERGDAGLERHRWGRPRGARPWWKPGRQRPRTVRASARATTPARPPAACRASPPQARRAATRAGRARRPLPTGARTPRPTASAGPSPKPRAARTRRRPAARSQPRREPLRRAPGARPARRTSRVPRSLDPRAIELLCQRENRGAERLDRLVSDPGADLPGALEACSTPVLICGVMSSSAPRRASIPSGVPAKSSAGIVNRRERPTEISPISRVRAAASAAPPPKNVATAGAAATAIPPRPMHSITAESPMSSAASSSRKPSRSSASCTGAAGAVNQRPGSPATWTPSRCRCAS